jgi:RNA polymerase sigma-70 factor (sigma-E family)
VIGSWRGEGTSVEGLRRAFEAHYEGLVRMATLLTGRQEVAEDLVQEAFVRAASRLEDLPRDKARPYLRAAVVNLWRNRLRRLSVEQRHDERPAEVGLPPIEEQDALWQAILKLPRRQRACVVLRYYEDLTEQATAHVMDCSVGTIKSQTSRALARLRKEFRDEGG